MAIKEITSQYRGKCAGCGRDIKSGKRVLYNAETGSIYHPHRDYGNCPDAANEAASPAPVRQSWDEYFRSGQYDIDEENEKGSRY